MWNYAWLSVLAKKAGGPEVLLRNMMKNGFRKGLTTGIIITTSVVGVSIISHRLYKYISVNKEPPIPSNIKVVEVKNIKIVREE